MRRVVIVGDSQAAGPVGQTLEALLKADGAAVTRVAESGHGAADWVRLHWARYAALVANVQPDDIILLFGSNDPANETLRQAFEQLQQAPTTVWYAGPPQYPSRPEQQARSAEIRALAQRVFGRRHLDAWPLTGPEVSRGADGIHFTRAGGEAWARGIVRQLRQQRSWPWIVGGAAAAALAVIGLWLWPR